MSTTEVILTTSIQGLGAEADVVSVRRGFARNFLIPKGKALEANTASLKQVEHLKARRAEREAQELNDAEELARAINKVTLQMTLETGETGKAFGSITNQDLAAALSKKLKGQEIDRHTIVLDKPIKTGGSHKLSVKLHPEVTATLSVQVKTETKGGEEQAVEE